MRMAPRQWLAFRLECEPPCEVILTDLLAPWFKARQLDGTLHRWFFLWYAAGGFHLRVRMLPAHGQNPTHLAANFQELAVESKAVRAYRQNYDRSTLAFGETRESVLAELLHSATSSLALELLPRHDVRQRRGLRWLLTAAAIAALTRRAMPASAVAGAMSAWRDFVERALRRRDVEIRSRATDARDGVRLPILRAVVPRVDVAVASSRAGRATAALLRRARGRGPLGCFVATHGLHLFCNEMGVGLAEEHDIANSLCALWTSGQLCDSHIADKTASARVRA